MTRPSKLSIVQILVSVLRCCHVKVKTKEKMRHGNNWIPVLEGNSLQLWEHPHVRTNIRDKKRHIVCIKTSSSREEYDDGIVYVVEAVMTKFQSVPVSYVLILNNIIIKQYKPTSTLNVLCFIKVREKIEHVKRGKKWGGLLERTLLL